VIELNGNDATMELTSATYSSALGVDVIIRPSDLSFFERVKRATPEEFRRL
jgi:hypothetical protein